MSHEPQRDEAAPGPAEPTAGNLPGAPVDGAPDGPDTTSEPVGQAPDSDDLGPAAGGTVVDAQADAQSEAQAEGRGATRAGTYVVWIADGSGEPIGTDTDGQPLRYPKPRDPRALEIYFGVQGGTPSKEKVDLQDQVERVLGTARRLYLEGKEPQPERFRRWYVRLFQLAQLGLEGDTPPTAMASAALTAMTQELIEAEAPRVKNGHLRQLGGWVLRYSLYCLWAYLILRLLPEPMAAWLQSQLVLDRTMAANFMLMGIGCFWGVWLSYGIRTVNFTLADLTRTDDDMLLPQMRLLFIGSLTLLIGLLFAFGVIEVEFGGFAASRLVQEPVIAFLVGAFCGIGEAALPGSIAGRASAFVGRIK